MVELQRGLGGSLARTRWLRGPAVVATAMCVLGVVTVTQPAGAVTKKAKSVRPATKKAPVKGSASSGTTGTAGSPAAFVPKVTWAPCGAGLECGQLSVPLDYSKAGAQTVQLGVARRAARNTAQRIGVLIVNPGGPAGSAFDMVSDPNSIDEMPDALLDRFDLVGIDPRGVNRSIPVLCAVAPSTSKDPTVASQEFATSCGVRSGGVLNFVGTDSSAEDIESMRIALGEQQVSYLGFSYGTYLGGLYAQAHPDRVRAMLLDGAMDPTRFGMAFLEDKSRAMERSLNAFFEACTAFKDCALKDSGKDPKARYEEMLLIASQTGIGAEKINRDALEGLVGQLLGMDWSALNQVLGDLSKGGTASAFKVFDYLGNDSSSNFEDGSFEAIACKDGLYPSSRPSENVSPAQRLTRFQAAAPHFLAFDGYWANDAMCSAWPVAPKPVAALSTSAGNHIVVIGNTLDLRTPYEWAMSLSRQLGAPLVTFRDYVHTAALSGEPCITGVTTSFLVDLVPPGSKKVC